MSSTARTASNGARDSPVRPSPRTEARIEIDLPIEPAELVRRGVAPFRGLPVRCVAPDPGAGRVCEQVHVDAHDRQRRPELVGDDAQELGPGCIERGQFGQPGLDLGGQPALLDDPREERRDRLEEGDLRVVEDAPLVGLDVEHADHRVVPFERHRQHPAEGPDVEAADPREPVVDRDVLDRDRRVTGGDTSGDALPPVEADAAHLRAIEAVGRGQRQAHPLVVGEIERADLDTHRGGRPVDDRMHELVPVARERGQLGDLVEERQLAEPTLRVHLVGRGGRVGRDRWVHRIASAGSSSRSAIRSSSVGACLRRSSSAGSAWWSSARASSSRPPSAWKQARL